MAVDLFRIDGYIDAHRTPRSRRIKHSSGALDVTERASSALRCGPWPQLRASARQLSPRFLDGARNGEFDTAAGEDPVPALLIPPNPPGAAGSPPCPGGHAASVP